MQNDPKTILIVDDDEAILEAIQISLELEGYNTATAMNARDALSASLKHPDVIVLDVLLSGHDGRDVVRKLKQQKSTEYIPVIMISAHHNIRDSVIEAGADDFLQKPFDLEVLLTCLRQYTHANQ